LQVHVSFPQNQSFSEKSFLLGKNPVAIHRRVTVTVRTSLLEFTENFSGLFFQCLFLLLICMPAITSHGLIFVHACICILTELLQFCSGRFGHCLITLTPIFLKTMFYHKLLKLPRRVFNV